MQQLKCFVESSSTHYAICNYRRDSKAKSWFIPAMIRVRAVMLLYWALLKRSMCIPEKETKIRSVYR